MRGHKIGAVEGLGHGLQVGLAALGEVLFHGHAAAQPGLGLEGGGSGFVVVAARHAGAPALHDDAAIERAHHVTNNAGFL